MTSSITFHKLPAIKAIVGKSRSSIYAAIKSGTFPAPVNIGPRSVAWTSTSIDEWQQSCINASKAA